MPIELCVLASGSGGNCSVVRTPAGAMLIDFGIGPRTAALRMKGLAVGVNDVAAVCLTHFDRDHLDINWAGTFLKNRAQIYCCARRVNELRGILGDDRLAPLIKPFDREMFEPLPGLTIQPIPLAHDCEGSHGFVLDSGGSSVGFATDLGRVPDFLVEAFEGVDLLAIESNYDLDMQKLSGRPAFLVQRIVGGRGHLSNIQALEAVKRVMARSQAKHGTLPSHIVLLHRSRQCNCPRLLRKLFSADARIAPRLVLAEQFERSEWLSAKRASSGVGRQLELAWG